MADGQGDRDLGLFGPSTVTWRIHQDPCMMVGGIRALLVQALNPLAMAAVDQHSDFRADPWGRFRRTSEYVSTTIFGDTASARAAGARVRAIHRSVRGIDPATRRPYRADDPELLLWIHNVEVDSFLTAYRRYGGRLAAAEADCYVAEMVRSGELVGLHEEDMPHLVSELEDYFAGVRSLCVTPAAREGLRLVLAPPAPLPGRLAWAVPATAAIAILPKQVRSLYGLPWFAPADPPLRLAVFSLCRTLRILFPPPPPVRDALERARSLTATVAA